MQSPSPKPAARPGHWSRRAVVPVVAAALIGVLLWAVPRLGPEPTIPLPSVSIPLPSVEPNATLLLAVGDVGNCGGTHDEAVAALATHLPGTIALLGDIAYPNGSASDYHRCFDPAWGSLAARFRPAPGNHEYQTKGATGYFAEFGPTVGTPGQSWYSYGLGSWHVVVLNSNCQAVGGCGTGSAQLAWLKLDLAAHTATCTLAYWHHPRYSSGLHGDNTMTDPLWQALAAAGADLVLQGHDHDYERFAPIGGIRSFVVGTGGRSLYVWPGRPHQATEVRANDSYGLLMLTLRASDYDWRFVPTAGSTFTDEGTGQCR